MHGNYRHAGPKSTQYNELEKMINQYYEMLQRKRYEHAQRFLVNIRKTVLINGCPEDDINSERINTGGNKNNNDNQNGQLLTRIGGALPKMRQVEDTLRGKLWRLVIGVGNLDANNYKNQIKKKEAKDPYYRKIRGDTKRTFLTSEDYNNRVSEERLVRVLNSFVHRYNKPYCQGMDAIAAGLLYVMPELDAFHAFSILANNHCPTYFHSDDTNKNSLIGAYAGSHLAKDILKICDIQIYNHLKVLPPYLYLFPLLASFQAISQPFKELQKLWDFLFCFGVHLNPVVATAQLIVHKKAILSQPPAKLVQGILAQRKWMAAVGGLNARITIDYAMQIIEKLKQSKHKQLWQQIAKHSNDFNVAIQIKIEHENGVKYKQITAAHISKPSQQIITKGLIDADDINDDDMGEIISISSKNKENDE